MKGLRAVVVAVALVAAGCGSGAASPATSTAAPSTTSTTPPTAPARPAAELSSGEVDAIYRKHIAPQTAGWDRISERMRHCNVYPHRCVDSAGPYAASVARKAGRVHDAIDNAIAEADGAEPSASVNDATVRLMMALTMATQTAGELDGCVWPHDPGSACDDAWIRLGGDVVVLRVLASDWVS